MIETSDRESRIRERAHALWEAEGRPDGRHDAHWSQAEREADADPAPAPAEDALDEPESLADEAGVSSVPTHAGRSSVIEMERSPRPGRKA